MAELRWSGTVSYTGFKRHLYFYATFTALWPDFNGYSCTWSNQTYQCTNRFGDGLRWKPYAQRSSSAETAVRLFTPSGNIVCEMADSRTPQGFVSCITISPPAIANLPVSGLVSICQHQALKCAGQLGEPGIPGGKLPCGTSKTLGRFCCSSASNGVTCIVTATGKGFFISKQSVRPVG